MSRRTRTAPASPAHRAPTPAPTGGEGLRVRPVRLSPRDVLALGMLGIRTRRVRAALSALGISLGIATMIVVTAIPASSQKALMERLSALGTNMLTAQAQPDMKPPVSLSEESVEMAARIGPVTAASAVANTHAVVNRSDKVDPGTYAGLTVLAARNNLPSLINARVRSGRFLDRSTDAFPTAVLGSVAATRLGLTSLPPGEPGPQIYINDRWFTVIGILAQTPLSPDIDRSVLVPWQPARTQLHFDGRPTVIYLKAEESRIEAVRDVLAATVNPQLPGGVMVSRPSDALAAKREAHATFSGLFLGLAAVALVVGGVGVANTMVVSVLERRREIGLRRALGASRGHIRLQFLTESIALSTLGGLAGTLLGGLATLAYTTYQDWPPVIPLTAVVGGVAGTVLVGAIAGLYPSLRAARLSPTEALAST